MTSALLETTTTHAGDRLEDDAVVQSVVIVELPGQLLAGVDGDLMRPA